ncbi:protein timeless-like [Apostichopus japonicus]|uniref:protein timeless-like n=1 Tax=Stichopus japonicus TaxID=307972 RepID=UPI003AB8043B
MEWLVMMGGGLNAVSSNLGWFEGDDYIISDECQENLEEMITSLKNENRVTLPVRKSYAASRLVEMDLFPILIAAKDQPEVYHRVVQLLVEITMPLEIAMPRHSSTNMEAVRTREVLKKMLTQSRKHFSNRRVIESVVSQIQCALAQCKMAETCKKTPLSLIQDSLKLVRNILHIGHDDCSSEIINTIMSSGFGDVIINICEADIEPSLVSSILAVLCLIFRNYNAKDIEWEASKLIAAETKRCTSPEVLVKEKLSEEPEVAGNSNTAGDSPGSPAENTSDSECSQKFSKDKLKEKIVQFALKFVQGSLNNILKNIAKSDLNKFFMDFHFLWHLTFFLSLAKLSVVKYHHISAFLSPVVVCTISYLMLDTWEQYSKAQRNKKDTEANASFKRLHLLATCEHYYFSCLHHFKYNTDSAKEAQKLQDIICSIVQAKSIRLMYVLLLRKFQRNVETMAYLEELVNGNHKLLALADSVSEETSFNMAEHIGHFATPKICLTYNKILRQFATNTLKQNEKVILMFHQISIGISKPEVLHQVPILDTISNIWEANTDRISSESSELFDYLVYTLCIKCQKRRPNKALLANVSTNWRKDKVKKKRIRRLKQKFTMANLDKVAMTGLYTLPSSSESETSGDEHVASLEENVASLQRIGFTKELNLLQELLFEICYLKLDCPLDHMAEPHVWPYSYIGKSVPLVAYTESQEMLQEEELFKAVMMQLGIQKDSSHLFPTIPSFWTAEMCFETASKLGPLNPAKFKFELNESGKPIYKSQPTFMPESSVNQAQDSGKNSEESVRDTVYRLPGSSWLMMVQAGNNG